MKGITMNLTRFKKIHLETVPTKARLKIIYKEYEPEGLQDAIVTAIVHRALMTFVKSGKLREPGDYEVGFAIKLPIMFWHKVQYTIRKL